MRQRACGRCGGQTRARTPTSRRRSTAAVARATRHGRVPLTEVARRHLGRVAVAGASLAAVAAVALATVGLPGGAPGVESAVAAVRKAAILTSASAERSGTAVVRIRHGGELWAGSTIAWNGDDLTVSQQAPRRPGRPNSPLLVVDGCSTGSTPTRAAGSSRQHEEHRPRERHDSDELLVAVREDVGGGRCAGSPTADRVAGAVARDGSTVYRGTVAAGLIARESGFKEGEAIRCSRSAT